MSNFSKVAAEVASALSNGRTAAAADKDADWQRVNSYIADVLKDSHVLYAKLARLQGDFAGEELDRLIKVSEAVLRIGDELSGFSKAFFEGKYDMAESEFTYGEPGSGAPAAPSAPPPQSVEEMTGGLGSPAPEAPAPEAPAPAPEAPKEEFDVNVEESGEEPDEDYSGEGEGEEEEKPAKKKEETEE